jgi:hypothetical protein
MTEEPTLHFSEITEEQLSILHSNLHQCLLHMQEICCEEVISSFIKEADLNTITGALSTIRYVNDIKENIHQLDVMLETLLRFLVLKDHRINETKFN